MVKPSFCTQTKVHDQSEHTLVSGHSPNRLYQFLMLSCRCTLPAVWARYWVTVAQLVYAFYYVIQEIISIH